MREHLTLFSTGLLQVSFVAFNSWQIAHMKWVGACVVGFIIGLIWSWNVKKIAFGSHLDRIVYAAGSAVGLLVGLLAVEWFYKG